MPEKESWLRTVLNRLRGSLAGVRDPLAEQVASLGPGFWVQPGPGGIWVVIGERTGLFVLAGHPGRGVVTRSEDGVLLNGKPLPPELLPGVSQAAEQARARVKATLHLTVWATPALIFSQAPVEPGAPVHGVHVIDLQYLGPLLKMPRSANPSHLLLWEGREKLASVLRGA